MNMVEIPQPLKAQKREATESCSLRSLPGKEGRLVNFKTKSGVMVISQQVKC